MTHDRHLVEQNFADLDTRLRQHGPGVGLAEIDGMACGMVAAGRGRAGRDDWVAMLGPGGEDTAIERVLAIVFGLACKSLGSRDFSFAPLVPDDSVDVSTRIEAVAEWCSGFLLGLRHVTGRTPPGPAGEAIDDILRLSELTPDERPAARQHRDLVEVIEYLRVGVQIVHEEFNRSPPETDLGTHQ